MASFTELQNIVNFLKQINYVYTEAENLRSQMQTLQEKYDRVIAGNDPTIPSGAWGEVMDAEATYTVSGNVSNLNELRYSVSGWLTSYEMVEVEV